MLLGLPALLVCLPVLWFAIQREPVAFDVATAARITCSAPNALVPGPGLPQGLDILAANNNLDLARFAGRFFLAFRTSRTHFASAHDRIEVLSSTDRRKWQYEATFAVADSGLREPRFLVFQDKLFLYFFSSGTHPLKFEPKHIHASERLSDAAWADEKRVFGPGYVPWRVRARDGRAYMSVYNGEGLYTTEDRAGDLRLLVSDDGYAWAPISDKPQVDAVGAEEGEFDFDDEGNLVATVRLETGGSLVCTAPKDDLTTWQTQFGPDKYDSAFMFRHGGQFYVVARRNVAGSFDRGADFLPPRLRRAYYLVRYSLTRKRTCLYRVDVAEKRLVPVLDFPSKGDTAFAGIVPLDEHSYYMANYSSPIKGPDWPWLFGQILPTRIYDTIIHFEQDAPVRADQPE